MTRNYDARRLGFSIILAAALFGIILMGVQFIDFPDSRAEKYMGPVFLVINEDPPPVSAQPLETVVSPEPVSLPTVETPVEEFDGNISPVHTPEEALPETSSSAAPEMDHTGLYRAALTDPEPVRTASLPGRTTPRNTSQPETADPRPHTAVTEAAAEPVPETLPQPGAVEIPEEHSEETPVPVPGLESGTAEPVPVPEGRMVEEPAAEPVTEETGIQSGENSGLNKTGEDPGLLGDLTRLDSAIAESENLRETGSDTGDNAEIGPVHAQNNIGTPDAPVDFRTLSAFRKPNYLPEPEIPPELVSAIPPDFTIVLSFTLLPSGYIRDLNIVPDSGNTEVDSIIKQKVSIWRFEPVQEEAGSIQVRVLYRIRVR